MRLLLTADLRYCLSWFKWLEAQAIRYEAVAIAGDLLDVFYKEPLKRQVQRTTAWLRSLASKSNVVVCSGNHDTIDTPVERSQCLMPAWLSALDPIVTVDGKTVVIRDQVMVTTLSFVATGAQKRPILAQGRRLREEKRFPWIVLHHNPPSLHEGIGQEELIAGHLANEFSPTFWVSGRLYGQEPFLKQRGWIQPLGSSLVLNTPQLATGQTLLESPIPNHIILDLAARKLTWHCPLHEIVDEQEIP